MSTLIVDNSIHRAFLREGAWIARYLKGRVEIRIGKRGLENIDLSDYDRVILTGSEASVLDVRPWAQAQMELVQKAIDRDIPLLGICFGHQLIARAVGGEKFVRRSAKGEFGWRPIVLRAKDELFEGIESPMRQLCTHFDEVPEPPPGFISLARSDGCAVHAMRMVGKPVWGIQFHPEISIREGKLLLLYIQLRNMKERLGIWAEMSSAKDSAIAARLFSNFLGVS